MAHLKAGALICISWPATMLQSGHLLHGSSYPVGVSVLSPILAGQVRCFYSGDRRLCVHAVVYLSTA